MQQTKNQDIRVSCSILSFIYVHVSNCISGRGSPFFVVGFNTFSIFIRFLVFWFVLFFVLLMRSTKWRVKHLKLVIVVRRRRYISFDLCIYFIFFEIVEGPKIMIVYIDVFSSFVQSEVCWC